MWVNGGTPEEENVKFNCQSLVDIVYMYVHYVHIVVYYRVFILVTGIALHTRLQVLMAKMRIWFEESFEVC